MNGFTEKQREYLNNATHRWNVKHGATRSGKTYLDYFVIPKRIERVRGKDGLIVILGNTKGTLQRNVIDPLQNIWGTNYVSSIRSDNTATLFGEKCYCLGADKVSQVDAIRGSGIKYCYGDEVVTWHSEVFNMVKSRLDKPYSRFDGTCNPADPEHWFKKFIDSDVDIFEQSYSIYDNEFLDAGVRAEMEKEYSGSVFFDRYILGLWVQAEGIIHVNFAKDPEAWIVDTQPTNTSNICIGCDIGGNKSSTVFVATAFVGGYKNLCVIDEERVPATGNVDVDEILAAYDRIQERTKALWCFVDNEAQAILNQMRAHARRKHYNTRVTGCNKGTTFDRITMVAGLLGSRRLTIMKHCTNMIQSLKSQRWDEKKLDTRLDSGADINIDTADAFEYSFNTYASYIARGY